MASEGIAYMLNVEYEDPDLFQDFEELLPMDTSEGGGASGNRGDDAPGDGDRGSRPVDSSKPAESAQGKTSVSAPSNMLQLGSVGAFSAPLRLWNDRVELDDPSEHVPPVISEVLRAEETDRLSAQEVVSPPSSPVPRLDMTTLLDDSAELAGSTVRSFSTLPVRGSSGLRASAVVTTTPEARRASDGSSGQEARAPRSPSLPASVPATDLLGGSAVGQRPVSSQASPASLAREASSPLHAAVSAPGQGVVGSPAPTVLGGLGGATAATASSSVRGVWAAPEPAAGGSPVDGLQAAPPTSSPALVTATRGVAVGGGAGGLSPCRASCEEVIAFGGIPDPVTQGRRISGRLQEQPDVDDIQLRCALRAAKLQDVETTTGMSVIKSNSILHFSDNEIIHNANQLGISLGNNDLQIAKSVNDILDLEAERAVDMIRHIAAVKPMNDSEIDALGVRVLDGLCADLDPALPETEEDTIPEVSLHVDEPEAIEAENACADQADGHHKPKRTWKRKVYPVSAARRSARIRTAKKNS